MEVEGSTNVSLGHGCDVKFGLKRYMARRAPAGREIGMQQSKDQLLYEQVKHGNIKEIRTLRNQGAGLEWVDKDRRTPLILACSWSDLRDVAEVLIELGADVNAYRPGRQAGTPLHHAARKGLERTVRLLLSRGANPLIMNDDCHMPLDLAREKGHVIIVRDIEGKVCLFCGWLCENYRPGFPEGPAPQFISRKVWAVVLPVKYELAIYTDVTVAEPTKVIHLWKCKLEEPKFNQADPSLIIVEISTRARHEFLSEDEGDKIQLEAFFKACRGLIAQVKTVMPTPGVAPVHNQVHDPNPPMPAIIAGPAVQAPSMVPLPPNQEDMELAMAINASIQSAIIEGVPDMMPIVPVAQSQAASEVVPPSNLEDMELAMAINASIQLAIIEGVPDVLPIVSVAQSEASLGSNGWATSSSRPSTFNRLCPPSSGTQKAHTDEASSSTTVNRSAPPATSHARTPVPTQAAAPPWVPSTNKSFHTGPIRYPSIDSSPINISTTTGTVNTTGAGTDKKEQGAGTCVICLDAPVEGACIPCGHMAGCMGCLREIKEKRGECPICRAKINQVLKLYAV
ncbi:RING/U-box superfamily protein [Rhynchospora pubera]|uniref:RING/U-box superfamily protein n=1 Tax=Rhynchospora pubera TaxID=906938 RepID=A0AAV8GJ31_9POAL|nr:RING/U-box superfamily protein [Rhynchospora pubera]